MLVSIKWNRVSKLQRFVSRLILAVPVRVKIAGIALLPVLVLGFSLNYWITAGLSDWLSYILIDSRVEAAMQAGSRSVVLVTILAAIASLLLSFLLTVLLTHPLIQLQETARQVARGNFETRAEVWANDEIGALAKSINVMIDKFDRYQADLEQTNKQLHAINQVAIAADRKTEIHDVLYIALENVTKLVELETAWVYLFDPDLQRLHLASWYGVPDAWQPVLLEKEDCPCRQDIINGTLSPTPERRPCQLLEKLHAEETTHISLPIEAQDKCFGVINLVCERGAAPTDAEMELLTSFSQQLSEIVANAWLRMKLEEKEAARQLLLQSLVTAQEEERSRLARELHDHAGQSMTGLLIQLKVLQRMCHNEQTETQFETAQTMIETIIDELSELSYRLHPPALEELGLETALRALSNEMSAEEDFSIHVETADSPEILSREEQLVLYRIAQEALTNVVRHAQARTVHVKLSRQTHAYIMLIEDDGVGFAPAQISLQDKVHHLGLVNMTERAELVGGSLEVRSSPGQGTRLRTILPITEIQTG